MCEEASCCRRIGWPSLIPRKTSQVTMASKCHAQGVPATCRSRSGSWMAEKLSVFSLSSSVNTIFE